MRLRRVDVVWNDATESGSGWQSFNDALKNSHESYRKSLCSTVGHVVYEDSEKIVIAQSLMLNENFDEDGETIRGMFVIPRGWIQSIEEWPLNGTEETTGNI